ncbi:DUF4249 family protein [Parabacteroides sp. PF5-9]|uniref:DUF4249 family protein n=1 Tax=Parabacteroides sp. PF5-9 TaxID=1742404 RepID=UPI002475AC14|nr:DUF4249 family protein [Parabacteroides sp. PF5-9]MDH6356696.1 hypothetical protein [Parabacteroides sp. PF5-9]
MKLKQTYWKNSLVVLFVCLFIVLFSCTERIQITTEDAPEHLVIYGYITNETMAHSVRITRSTGYFSPNTPAGVSGAVVQITTGKEVFKLTENKKDPGLYETKPDVTGVAGKEYVLSVSVDVDGDGVKEEFEATDCMPYPAEIDSIKLRESVAIDDHLEVQLYGRVPKENKNSYFSFHAYRNGALVNDSLTGFFIMDDEHLVKTEFFGLPCFYLDQDDDVSKLNPGDYITLRVDILTKAYADFLNRAQMQVYGSNPIFSGPPANVESNIRSVRNTNKIPIVGFFGAFSGKLKSAVYELEK